MRPVSKSSREEQILKESSAGMIGHNNDTLSTENARRGARANPRLAYSVYAPSRAPACTFADLEYAQKCTNNLRWPFLACDALVAWNSLRRGCDDHSGFARAASSERKLMSERF
jgi:hypothetical protein